jgi:septal ring factor EnvC (AmiA/AmiB activator)
MLAGGDKDAQKAALQAANKGWERPPAPVVVSNPVPPQAAISTATFGQMTTQPPIPVSTQVVAGFGGKEAPVQPPHPEK